MTERLKAVLAQAIPSGAPVGPCVQGGLEGPYQYAPGPVAQGGSPRVSGPQSSTADGLEVGRTRLQVCVQSHRRNVHHDIIPPERLGKLCAIGQAYYRPRLILGWVRR